MREASGAIARFPNDPEEARRMYLSRVEEKKIAGLTDPLFAYNGGSPEALFDLAWGKAGRRGHWKWDSAAGETNLFVTC